MIERGEAATIVRRGRESILRAWLDRATADIASSRRESLTGLRNHLPDFIENLADVLENPSWTGQMPARVQGWQHGNQRADTGHYSLEDVFREYKLLRRCVFEVVDPHGQWSAETGRIVHQAFDDAIQEAASAYVERTRRDVAAAAEQTEAILNAITDGFYVVDRNWTFTFVNGQVEPLLDRAPGSLLHRNLWDEIPGLKGTVTETHLIHAMRVREASSFTHHNTVRDRWYLVRVSPMPNGIAVYFQDVTKQRRAEFAATMAEEQLRLATKGARLGIWDQNLQTGELLWSHRAKEMFGLDVARPVDMDLVMTRLHPDDRAPAREAMAKAADPRGDGAYRISLRAVLPDARVRWTQSIGKVLFEGAGGDRRAVRFTGVVLDVTEQLRTESDLRAAIRAAEIANETKSAFLANMSHEIRTPLGAILGFTDLLRDETLAPRERDKFLNIIDRNGQALTRIIDDILDLSKVEAGKLTLEIIPFSVHALLEEVIALFREACAAKGIALSLIVDDDVPALVKSDPTRIRQILINLIGNAVKFTAVGGVRVRVGGRATAPGAPRVECDVEIRDTGIGLTAEQQARLFNPFSQADGSTTRRYGGTGLGLALSQRLAGALGGEIAVADCAPDRGCTFTLRFSAGSVRPGKVVTPPPEPVVIEGPGPAALNGLHVLLAEDSPDNQFLIGTHLQRQGATVDFANDGGEAVRRACERDYDVVLMDIQMPGIDGYAATRELRGRGYRRPIVALTAHAMLEERRKTQAAGCDAHVTKPLDVALLIQTIRGVTGGRDRGHSQRP